MSKFSQKPHLTCTSIMNQLLGVWFCECSSHAHEAISPFSIGVLGDLFTLDKPWSDYHSVCVSTLWMRPSHSVCYMLLLIPLVFILVRFSSSRSVLPLIGDYELVKQERRFFSLIVQSMLCWWTLNKYKIYWTDPNLCYTGVTQRLIQLWFVVVVKTKGKNSDKQEGRHDTRTRTQVSTNLSRKTFTGDLCML